jgi:hypothetical protein
VRVMLFRGSFYLCIPAAARCQGVGNSIGGLKLELGILEVEARNAYHKFRHPALRIPNLEPFLPQRLTDARVVPALPPLFLSY